MTETPNNYPNGIKWDENAMWGPEITGADTTYFTGFVIMDSVSSDARQKEIVFPVSFQNDPVVNASFLSPDPSAKPMVIYGVAIIRGKKTTTIKFTGVTVDGSQESEDIKYYMSYFVSGRGVDASDGFEERGPSVG